MSPFLSEVDVEEAAIGFITEAHDFAYIHGSKHEPNVAGAERKNFSDGLLQPRLRSAVLRLNDGIGESTADDIVRKVANHETTDLVLNNRRFHKFVVEGVPYEYYDENNNLRHGRAKIIDLDEPSNNDWLIVNQFTVKEHKRARIPDVVIFVNGLPLVVIEFKDPTDEKATIESAYKQIQTYKDEIPNFMAYNEFVIIADGPDARLGTITSDFSRFNAWKDLENPNAGEPEFDTLARSVFEPLTFLDILRYFILFETDGVNISKKVAGYHQYRATNRAVEATKAATAEQGQRRIGVIWHTTGSGKSLMMTFYAGKVIQQEDLENPTLVVITDRNDLDGQLHGQFARAEELLRQESTQAKDRDDLKRLLAVPSGGIVFTTVQKFFPDEKHGRYPMLTNRRNVIVIADEAHRSQYDMIDGFARHMRDALPNASFIGFTGTPIEMQDRNTRQVFGDYIDTYDIEQSIKDGATVPIYYEARIAKLDLKPEEIPHLDSAFDEIVENEAEDRAEKVKRKNTALEALVGAKRRVEEIAKDILGHFARRTDPETGLAGKAMVVCMSRRICADMYNAIGRLQPDWVDDDDAKGAIKVVMTGNATDGPEWQKHIRNKTQLKAIERRIKNPDDPLKMVIVCDMWLTGFDVPSLHTLYIDKPMKRHSLIQAISRVNRVFKDKPAGLVVDYLGIADELKLALSIYTESGGHGKIALTEEEAVPVLQTKYEVVRDMYYGFDYEDLLDASPQEKIQGLVQAADFILGLDDGRERYLANTADLLKAFALASTYDYAISIRDEVEFFLAVRARIAKARGRSQKSDAELDSAVKQLVTQAIASDGIVDILSEAGIKRPEISVLSDDFLKEIKGLPQKNLARELLERLLRDEIRKRSQRNAVQSKRFSELLQATLQQYKNRAIESAEVIMRLIELARDIQALDAKNKQLGLTEDEVAFYDALAQSHNAEEVLGDRQLRIIAAELVKAVKKNVSIDWTLRETAKAKIRTIIKRILREYGYPPDEEKAAVEGVLEQAELLCRAEAA